MSMSTCKAVVVPSRTVPRRMSLGLLVNLLPHPERQPGNPSIFLFFSPLPSYCKEASGLVWSGPVWSGPVLLASCRSVRLQKPGEKKKPAAVPCSHQWVRIIIKTTSVAFIHPSARYSRSRGVSNMAPSHVAFHVLRSSQGQTTDQLRPIARCRRPKVPTGVA